MWTALPSANESLNEPLLTGILRFSPRTVAVAFPTQGIENEPVARKGVLRRAGEDIEVPALPLHHRFCRGALSEPGRDRRCVENAGDSALICLFTDLTAPARTLT